ncbi:MAG: amidohydrolase family protein [Marinicaulis sp.]|nr:amidohydrolase family protein [Marinicaulis sp.]
MNFAVSRAICAALIAAPFAAFAEDDDEKKWDVNNPGYGETREVAINVDEGTWMNVDVSPDGRTIAFDLLGDIYTMPIAGGAATRIAEGMNYDMQPRFSPDGSKIAFTSDRSGGNNIWVMNRDGSEPRQITKEKFRLLNNPTWSPSGEYIAARKHFTTQRSLGVGEIWMYHINGGGGVKLVKRPSEAHQKELGEPMFSEDGKYIYYAQNVTPGSRFIYAQNSNQDLFNIKRYEMATGDIETAVSGAGGAVRPTPSPNGKYMAFVRRDRMQSKLYIKDMKSGEARAIYDDLDRDLQEIWAVHGLYPNMDWLPDSKSLVFWAGGKIRRINVETGVSSVIAFSVDDSRTVIAAPRPAVEVAPDNFKTKMPRFASVSPNGKSVVFESLGKLYIKSLPNGAPRRLTRSDGFQFFPSWSRDGRRIVFVSWTDEGLGSIRTVSASGGSAKTVTREPGHYRRPQFSPDGKTIVFEKDRGGYLTNDAWSEAPGVYRVAAGSGNAVRVATSGSFPHFGADASRVFMTNYEGDTATLISVDLDGNDKREHASGEMITGYQVSPSGTHLAFTENYNVFAMPMTPGPQKIAAGRSATALPVVNASGVGATYSGWSRDRLNWSLGPTLYSASIAEMFAIAGEGDDGYSPPESGADLSITVTAAKPTGVTALTNARIITMAGDDGGVIENGVVVIDGNRIAAVGGADTAIPAGARTVDMAGKTIMPGLIDAHAHGPYGSDDIIPQQNWSTMAHLALGVTTIHDPSNAAGMVFPSAEYQRAGLILAPRTYSTAEIVYGAKSPFRYAHIDNADDAAAHVKRLKSQGAFSIKNYNQPRRDQRQQVIAAGLDNEIAVVAEGGSLFHMDISLIQDGITSIEHNMPQEHFYEDVLTLYSESDAAYTPTLVVAFGGVNGDSYWRAQTNVWEHPILAAHAPPRVLQSSSVRRTTAPEEDFYDNIAAAAAKSLADRGVAVSIGAHGQQQGLASHWELWSFARGGMSPLQVLRTGTTDPARHLGLDADIGSLEEGKLADLVVLNSNPLDDIRKSDDISHVMLNGRLYDAVTLNEVTTGSYERAPYWWE